MELKAFRSGGQGEPHEPENPFNGIEREPPQHQPPVDLKH